MEVNKLTRKKTLENPAIFLARFRCFPCLVGGALPCTLPYYLFHISDHHSRHRSHTHITFISLIRITHASYILSVHRIAAVVIFVFVGF